MSNPFTDMRKRFEADHTVKIKKMQEDTWGSPPAAKPISIVYSGITKQVLDKPRAELIGEVTYTFWPLSTSDMKWTLRQAPIPGVDRSQLWLTDSQVPAKVKLALALLQ